MENRAHALAAGLFILLLGAALVAVGLWFRKDDILRDAYVITTTSSVSGLKVEAPVRYRGVEVGRVESIRIEPGAGGRINIRILVNQDTPITKSTYAQLGYQGVTGLAAISLSDDGSSPEPLDKSGNDPPQIAMRPSLFDSGADLLTSVNGVADRLNDLLDDDNQKLVKRTLTGLEQATLRTAALADKAAVLADKTAVLADQLTPGVKNLPALVTDARGAVAKAEQLMANLGTLSTQLEQRIAILDRVVASADEVGATARAFNDETVPRLNSLVEQLNRETRALDRVLSTLGDNPQSVVFGAPPGKPGPGEPGFAEKRR